MNILVQAVARSSAAIRIRGYKPMHTRSVRIVHRLNTAIILLAFEREFYAIVADGPLTQSTLCLLGVIKRLEPRGEYGTHHPE